MKVSLAESLRATAAAMITSVAQFKSHMTAKSATRSSAKMAKKMPSASTDVSVMPRRSEFPHGGDGDKEWGDKVDTSMDNYGKAICAQTTSDEHDMYLWSFNEYTASVRAFHRTRSARSSTRCCARRRARAG